MGVYDVHILERIFEVTGKQALEAQGEEGCGGSNVWPRAHGKPVERAYQELTASRKDGLFLSSQGQIQGWHLWET